MHKCTYPQFSTLNSQPSILNSLARTCRRFIFQFSINPAHTRDSLFFLFTGAVLPVNLQSHGLKDLWQGPGLKRHRQPSEGGKILKILTGNGPFPPRDPKPLLAVGNFDGVHLGHQRVFKETVSRASELGLSSAVLTFSGHPLRTLSPFKAPMPIMLPGDRLKIAEDFGFKTAYILDFDPYLASMSPGLFMKEILLGAIGAGGIVAGVEWRFGRGREGNMEILDHMGRDLDFEVVAVDPAISGGIPVSSTRVRDLISDGDVAMAGELLGRPHFVRGTVYRGRGLGKDLGFPTANLDPGSVLIPGEGIYGGAYIHSGRVGPAAVSIGKSPTFPQGASILEAHLVGWEGDLYGKNVTLAFFRRLRSHKVFHDGEVLSRQIARDVQETEKMFTLEAVRGVPG